MSLRILDLSRVLAGPWATQQLADQGAEVIKIEPPGGDDTRGFGPVVDGHSTYFLAANRNKRAMTLNLKTEAGREILEKLIAQSDVLVENFRPGVLERLGFSWERLHAAYPQLIYIAIHAFGDTDDPDWRRRPGYDLVLQCMGGGAELTGASDGPPQKHGNSIADLTAGLMAVGATWQALYQREATGTGQRIVVNMMQAQAACLTYHATRFSVTGTAGRRRDSTHAGLVPYRIYRCADGWFSVGCGNDAIWQRLRTALELPDREEWRTNVGRVADRATIDELVQDVLAELDTTRADQLMADAGVPAGPVLRPDQVLEHPMVETVEVDHPTLGTVELPGPVVRTETTRATHTRPPLLGEHRDAILTELGLDAAAIASLASQGAFGT